MADGKVSLTEEQSTLLATLYGRAVDALAARPILGDPYAAGVVRGIDFDFKKTRITPGTAGTVALRAKHLDDWTQQFLAAHTEAIVLHLGCGLDSPRTASTRRRACAGSTSTTPRSSSCAAACTRRATGTT